MAESSATGGGFLERWHHWPLYLRILGAVLLGVVAGVALGALTGTRAEPAVEPVAHTLETASKLVLRMLGALAAPLILVAVVHALMRADLPRGSALRLISLLVLNTLVAITIGLVVANVMQPGRFTRPPDKLVALKAPTTDPLSQILDNVPKSVLGPLGDDGKVIGVILLAIAFGMALRRVKDEPLVEKLVDVSFRVLIIILHWIIQVIPIAVFGIVASTIALKGFHDFIALGMFIVAVLVALLLQAAWYLVRIHFGSWVRPWDAIRGVRDALVMAFSTASSTATMPLTYACLRERVGLRERSASLGALIGANFNNDGTALYEAMAALFIAQMLGHHLTLTQQLIVMLTSVVASVGAAGIPEAGLVTMILVLKSVGLPPEYNLILLTVDWFLDRCRTAVNVLGDVNVSCLLDGRTREAGADEALDTPELGELSGEFDPPADAPPPA